jgi:hypothetical protein
MPNTRPSLKRLCAWILVAHGPAARRLTQEILNRHSELSDQPERENVPENATETDS